VAIKQVIDEVNALYQQFQQMATSVPKEELADPKAACPLVVFHTSALRNKRCLLAYLKARMDKLRDLRWQSGSAIPQDLKRRISAEEQQYFENYDALLGNYMRSMDLDLTADQQPPKNLYIEVRVLEDCGEILTESGSINLERNTTHFLRRSDVEHLVRQGMLEEV